VKAVAVCGRSLQLVADPEEGCYWLEAGYNPCAGVSRNHNNANGGGGSYYI